MQLRRQILMWLAIVIPVLLILITTAMYVNLDETSRRLSVRPAVNPSPDQSDLTGEPNSILPDDAVPLQELTTIASLPGAVDHRRRLIIRGTSAYVFNAQEQVVHRVGLGDQRIIEVLKAGDTKKGVLVDRLVDMAWVPAGGVRDQGAVMIVDVAGTAWQIDAVDEVTPLRVVGTANWRNPQFVGGFAGNLYMLDAGINQILRYAPTLNGYEIPPDAWLPANANMDLGNVVDLAIDGAIYLLRSDGRVDKFVTGQPALFEQAIAFDPEEAIACFAMPPASSVFLVTRTRILQLDTVGSLQRELVPPAGGWQHISALWVDESAQRLYGVDAGALVMASLPDSVNSEQ